MKSVFLESKANRLAIATITSVLLLTFLVNRKIELYEATPSILSVRMAICLLSLCHAWLITLYYRSESIEPRVIDGLSVNSQQAVLHIILFLSSILFILVWLHSQVGIPFSSLHVLLSYFFGISVMFLVFKCLRLIKSKKLAHSFQANFAVFITTWIVLGGTFYNYTAIGKWMIDWYLFGNALLNFG